MAYTLDQLTAAYRAVHDGVAPDAATLATFQVQATLSANGQMSDAQLLSAILNSADGTTALAVLSYQFFTGKSPTAAGLDYLVNSTTNPADLNDPYYSRFSLENRYINFAANLGVQGEGAVSFAAKYGALSFADYVASIYQTIIGASYATASGIDPAKAIADIVARKDAILATATSAGMVTPNMTAAQIDIALKAATAGYLLGEAIKADVGLYAAAANNFMAALAQGNAIYNTDITRTYAPTVESFSHGTGKALDRDVAPPAPPTTTPTAPSAHAFTLGAGVNLLTGGALDDTFTATDQTFHAGDTLNGGGGNDTLTVTATGGLFTVPAATVRNIETANLINTGGLIADTTGWTGLVKLNTTSVGQTTVTAAATTDIRTVVSGAADKTVRIDGGHDIDATTTGVTTGGIIVGSVTRPTGAVVIDRTIANGSAAGQVGVNGGTTIDITQRAANATATAGAVNINGAGLTTSVTTKTLGASPSSVLVTDPGSGTITTIDIDGYNGAILRTPALTTLKLAHGSGTATLDVASPGSTTLNLTVNGVTGTVRDNRAVYSTLNLTTGSLASAFDLDFAAMTTMTLAGATVLTLGASSVLTALQTLTITGATGLNADLSSAGNLASIDASNSTGASVLKINPGVTAFTGGSAADTLTLGNAVVTQAIAMGGGDDIVALAPGYTSLGAIIDGGAGAGDVIRMTATDADIGSSSHAFDGKLLNFERLEVTTPVGDVIDMAHMGGIHHVTVGGNSGGPLTFQNMTSGDTLVMATSNLGIIAQGLGAGSSLNLTLRDTAGAGLTFGSLSAAGLESLAITTEDGRATPTGAIESLTIASASLRSVTAAGDAGLKLTTNAGATALASVDASALTLGGLNLTLGASASTLTIKGSATAANTVDLTGVSPTTLNYTGGSGADTLTMGVPTSGTISLGDGDDTVTIVGGVSVGVIVDGGAGVDTLRLAAIYAQTAYGYSTRAINFERLALYGVGAYSIDISNLGQYHHVTTSGGQGTILTGFVSDDTLVLNGGGLSYDISGAFTGGADTLNLTLSDTAGAGVAFASNFFKTTGVETLNIATQDGRSTPTGAMESLVLTSTDVQKIVVTGNAGLDMRLASSTALTSFDASGITLGGLKLDLDASASAVTIKGSATAANTIDASGVTADITYTGGTGVDTVTLGSTTASGTINLGAGDDVLVLASGTTNPLGTLDGGAGANDVLRMSAADAANAAATFKDHVTGFERLELTGVTGSLFNVADLGAYHYVTVASGGGGATLNLQGLSSGDTLVLAAPILTFNGSGFAGASDSYNLILKDTAGAGQNFGVFNANSLETLNITTADGRTTPTGATETLQVRGSNLQQIVISGNAGMHLTSMNSPGLASIDASGVTVGGLTLEIYGAASDLTIKGAATGTNLIDQSGVQTNLTYVGGSGADTVSVIAGKHTLTLGGGADKVFIMAAPTDINHFTTIMDLEAGDKIVFTENAARNVQVDVHTAQSLGEALDLASTTPVGSIKPLNWFEYQGDTYLVVDMSAANTFQFGVDYVVKLAGVTGVSMSGISNGLSTTFTF